MKISKLFIGACLFACSSTFVLADGMVFEPVEIPTSNPVPTTTKAPAALPEIKNTSPASNTAAPNTTSTNFFDRFKSDEKVADMSLKENQKMQSALTDLDCSQVELRENLQKSQTDYSSVDKNYLQYKAERAKLKKEIKVTNKKLKNLEKVKKTIRKNML